MKKTLKSVIFIVAIIGILILAGISILAFKNRETLKKTKETNQSNGVLDEYVDEKNKYESKENSKIYKVGDEVKIGDEEFFVISDKGTTVELLSKYVLNSEVTAQEDKDADCAFSTDNYWREEELILNGSYFNLNTYSEVQNDTGSAVYKANSYAKRLGAISGRLLTYEEANSLANNYSNIIFITYGNSRNYWLASAIAVQDVWSVNGKNRNLRTSYFGYTEFCGVRPVIEISKTLIK